MHASLPMYDLPELTAHTDALWSAIAARCRTLGCLDVPSQLHRPAGPLLEHWRDPDLLLSQSCGYPVVALLPALHVLGSFACRAGDRDRPGWYRSALVCRDDDPRADVGLAAFDGARVVGNDDWSLSGWVSLGAALADAGVRPGAASLTGAHGRSVIAVRDGAADLACIDAHTLALLRTHRPDSVRGLRAFAHGPDIAATPLVTAHHTHVALLRTAIAAAIDDLDATTRDALQIDAFVAGGREMHTAVPDLVARAETVLTFGR